MSSTSTRDADFLYGRLLCSEICVVQNKWTKVEFQRAKKNKISRRSVRCLSIVVLMFFFSLFPIVSCGNQQFQNRCCTTFVLLSQILNFTTSDPRQDGQSPPFTTSSSQRVHGMRNCRASIAAETEKLSLMEHQRLYPLLFAF